MITVNEIQIFLNNLLYDIAKEIEYSKNPPHLTSETYKRINIFRELMYNNNLSNYSNLFDIYSKYHYMFETNISIISQKYPNRINEYDSNKGSRSIYKLIPDVYCIHDIIDCITHYDIPCLVNELINKPELFIQLKNELTKLS